MKPMAVPPATGLASSHHGSSAGPLAVPVPPLVMHVVYRFDTGGLENGVVNLINHMPVGAFRHMVLALSVVTDFRRRVTRPDVEFIALNKPPGHAVKLYPRLVQLFRHYRPAIVHTRNLAALEAAVPAWFAGVPVRIHGEHGRDVDDLDGSRRKYQWMRRIYRPWVNQYVALSQDLATYLEHRVGIPRQRIKQIYNGVDIQLFHPALAPQPPPGCPFKPGEHWIVGSVGRMQQVKDPLLLANAFVRALQLAPDLRARLRLVMVGDGPMRQPAQAVLDAAGLAGLAWLPGERHDVPDVMRGLDCFVLPSRAEGVSKHRPGRAGGNQRPLLGQPAFGNASGSWVCLNGVLRSAGRDPAAPAAAARQSALPHGGERDQALGAIAASAATYQGTKFQNQSFG